MARRVARIGRRAFVPAAVVALSGVGPALGRTTRRVGILSLFSAETSKRWHDSFVAGLRDLGWKQDENLDLRVRYAGGRIDALGPLAAELVAAEVEVILAQTAGDARAVHAANPAVPVVMASSPDLVRLGLAQSLPRPAGMITGLSEIASELTAKRLQQLHGIVPDLKRLAVLTEPTGVNSRFGWEELQAPARGLGVETIDVAVAEVDRFEAGFASARSRGAQAILILPNPLFGENLPKLASLATEHRLPGMFHLREFAELGGLVTYGADRRANFRRAARYVDRILHGVSPLDLPIEQPTRVELVVNLRAAAALGLSIPPAVLVGADETIE